MAQALLDLSKLISGAVERIDSICKARGTSFPSLDRAFDPAEEIIRTDPEIMPHLSVLVASADQLVATGWVPQLNVMNHALGFHVSSALRAAAECNVAETLRDAGQQGLHVRDIAKGHVVPSEKLARVLRLLATRHVFREVSPDVFANNRLSSLLDTHKSLAELRANPLRKHDGTIGFTALVEHNADEMFKAASYLPEALMDPSTAKSDSLKAASFTRSRVGASEGMWEWFEQPQHARQLARFGIAMNGVKKLNPESDILDGFDWLSLPRGATIVDVGGGVGAISLLLSTAVPHANLVVQDRPMVVEDAKKFWTEHNPDALNSGRVSLEGHDFFDAQPRKGANVFILRSILHDWADSYATTILKKIREAAGNHTRLLIAEQIVPYACAEAPSDLSTLMHRPTPPQPLLANLGVVNQLTYLLDLNMLVGFNGQERTLAHFDALLLASGWKIERVYDAGSPWKQLTARPV